MASSISDFSAHRKNYSYCYVYGTSNVGHWEIKTQQIFVIGVLIPMDYEDYYYEFRSRYYDACSEVNNYENRANELRSQRQRKIIYINQLKSDLKRHQKLLKEHHETKQEITIKPFDNDGNLVDYNVRADEITNDFFNEVKASDTAPYTQNQKNGGMIRGKGKDGFLGGTILGPLKGYTTRNGITRSILDDMNLIGGN